MTNDKNTGSRRKRLSRAASALFALLLALALSVAYLPAAYAEGGGAAETAVPSEEPQDSPLPAESPTPAEDKPVKTTKVGGRECVDGEIIVKFKNTVTGAKMAGALAAADSGVQQELPADNIVVAEVPEGETVESFIGKMKGKPEVEYAQPNYIYHADMTINDPYAAPNYQWHLRTMGAFDAWDITMGSSGIKVAVVDTGIDLDHPDLAGKITAQKDFVNGDNVAQDDEGHGTHVAGIIAANANNGKGVAGVAPGVRLIAVKVLNSKGVGTTSACANGVYYAANNGADVINMSFGGYEEDPALTDAVDYAVYNKGAVCVAAAGNESTDYFSSPSDLESCIAVTATDASDKRAYYSDYGPSKDISAPGDYVYSTFNPATDYYYYGSMSGTSMASPVVAGVAALILSVDPSLTVDQVKDILYSTAVDLGDAGKDDYYGYGRVNAAAAVYKAANLSMFSSGSGSAGSPYDVSTPEELNAVRYYPEAYFSMSADIDMAAATSSGGKYYYSGYGWWPISFLNGSFDGQGYSINGLNITDSGADYVGLFGHINAGAAVSNLNITSGYIIGDEDVGGIAGKNDGDITYCSFSGYISGDANYVGGIAGECIEGSIKYCTNSGNVSGYSYAGGITGYLEGLASECYNSGEVRTSAARAGGIAGEAYSLETGIGKIEKCYNTGKIIPENPSGYVLAGGIVGDCFRGTVINCFNTGEIVGEQWAGGIAGRYYNSDTALDALHYCYSIGNKAIVGDSFFSPYSCYYLDDGLDHAYGTPKTREELLAQATYSGFDFTDTWQMVEGERFPTLKGVPFTYVEGITLPDTIKIKLGQSGTLTPEFSPAGASNKNVSWVSSDSAAASVSEGTVTLLSDSPVTVTVTTQDGNFTDVCEILRLHEYTIGAQPNNTAYGTVSGSRVYDEDTTVTLTAIPSDGYRFLRWTEDSTEISTSPVLTFTAAGDRTLTAEFALIDTPAIISISAPDYNKAELSWSPVEGANGYEVWRSTSASGTYSRIVIQPETSYTNLSLKPGTTYYYKIKAYCVAGDVTTYGSLSPYSSARPVPLAPASCSASEADYNSIRVEWSPVVGATGYMVYRSTSEGGEYARVATTSRLYYTNNYVDTGAAYYYKVRAYHDYTSIYGDYSPVSSVATSLEPMEGVIAAMDSPTAVKISWSPIPGASGYRVYRSDTEGGEYSDIGGTSYSYSYYRDKYLKPNQIYYYKVLAYRAVSGGNYEGGLSGSASAMPEFGWVVQVNAAAYSPTSSKIIWGAVPGSAGYDVFKCEDKDGSNPVLLTTSSTPYTGTYWYDKNLEPNATYYYFVQAYAKYKDGGTYKEFVTDDSEIVSTLPALGKVTEVKAAQYTLTSVKISWKAVAGRTGYEVQMCDAVGNNIGNPKRTSYTYYTWTGLPYGQEYSFKVRAYVAYTGGPYSGDYSDVISLEAGLRPLPKVKAVAYSAAKVKLTWGYVPYRSGYAVMFCDADGNQLPDTQIVTTGNTYYYHANLTPETEYHYRVCAYKLVGTVKDYGPWSDRVSAKPVLAGVTGAKAAPYSLTSVKVSWNAVWGVSGYEVQPCDADGNSAGAPIDVSGKYTTVAGVTGTEYYFKVRAYAKYTNGARVYSAFSAPVGAAPGLAAMSGVKAGPYTLTSVRISWDAVAGRTGYRVQRCDSAGNAIGSPKTTTYTYYTWSGLTTDTTYYFKVCAYKGGYENEYSIVSAVPGLKQVTGAKAAPYNVTTVKLTWKYVPYTTYYEIWACNSVDEPQSIVATTGNTYYYVRNLEPGTYRYRVRAYRTGEHYGEYSGPLTAVLPAFDPPAVVKAGPYSLTSVKISWSKVWGASGYRVQMCDAAGNPIEGSYKTTPYTYCIWSGLTLGNSYKFKVCAYEKSTGMTKYSAYPDTAVEAKPGLKQVTGAKAARTGVMSVKISWSYVSYRTGYEIWRCDTEDGEYTKVGATAGTYFYNYWVVPGETYYYKVKAYRISGGVTYYGDFSNVVSATA